MKILIQFDPTEDSVESVAEQVSYAYGFDSMVEALGNDAEEPPVATNGASGYPDGWTRPKMLRYMRALQPNARDALVVMAKHAPTVSSEDLQQEIGLKGAVFAGTMSSHGFARRNTWGVKELPYEKRYDEYAIDPKVAELVLEVAANNGW